MSETGFKCPRCGQTAEFDAYCVVLTGTTHITEWGWNYFDYPNDVELYDNAWMKCCKCGHEGKHEEFEED